MHHEVSVLQRHDREVLLHVLQKTTPRFGQRCDGIFTLRLAAHQRARPAAQHRWQSVAGARRGRHAGRMPGVDEEEFRIYAAEAETNRPVSLALAGIPEIVLTAKLV
jgi:hypothetical protein